MIPSAFAVHVPCHYRRRRPPRRASSKPSGSPPSTSLMSMATALASAHPQFTVSQDADCTTPFLGGSIFPGCIPLDSNTGPAFPPHGALASSISQTARLCVRLSVMNTALHRALGKPMVQIGDCMRLSKVVSQGVWCVQWTEGRRNKKRRFKTKIDETLLYSL